MPRPSLRPNLLQPSGLLVLVVAFAGCSQRSGEMAAQGAATGAAAGAVGGLVSALVFGGNAGEAAARGAVWGGSTGAVAGGISGASMDAREREAQRQAEQRAAQQAQDAELDRLRNELGDDAYEGLAALADGRHDVAIGYARTASRSSNPDHALAGLWIEALALADRGDRAAADEILDQIVPRDPDVKSYDEAKKACDDAAVELERIRAEYR